jgi:nitroreductase
MITKIGGMIKNKPFELIDVGIAAEHLCLQAAEEGLGTCMLGWFDEKGIKKILNLPKQVRIELVIILGYPETEKVRLKKRKPLNQILKYNK